MTGRIRGKQGRRSLVLLLALVLVYVSAGRADAVETESFRLEPWPLYVDGYERRSFDYDIEPGTIITDAIRITNKTDQLKRFRVQAADAQRSASGQMSIGGRGSVPRAMGNWITLDRNEVEIPARSTEVVSFRFERPQDQNVEGFGAIAVEELREAQGPGVDVAYRLALIVQLGGEAPTLKATRPDLTIPVRPVPSAGTVSTLLHNETLERTDAVVRFGVSSLTGRIWLLEEVRISLEPGERRRIEQTWTTVPRWGGVLRPEVEVGWQRGSIALAGARSLHPPLWLLALIILAVGIRAAREYLDESRGGDPPSGTPSPPPTDREFALTR